MKNQPFYIYGKHPVAEALVHRPDTLQEIFLTDRHAGSELQKRITDIGVPHTVLNEKQLPSDIDREAVHQGVVAVIAERKLTQPYKEFISKLEVGADTALLVLGEVQDPHNVGAVIRSATAFGIAGVLIPPHKQAQVNATVVKVSAGTAFRVPLVNISNVNATLRDLQTKGFWVYGLDSEGETKLSDEQFERPSVFVLGNEGTGLRKMTREACDELLSIPISSRCESLNASVGAATVFYEWARQHPQALGR